MNNKIKVLDIEKKLVEEYLEYFPETGLFIWKLRPNTTTSVGDIAGTLRGDGYIRIILKGKRYYAHRLAYLLMEGVWPFIDIDHINTIRSDNSWVNLRESTKAQQAHNRKVPSNSTTGVKGLSIRYNSHGQPYWFCQVTANKQIYTRSFNYTLKEKAIGWLEGIREYLHGEFTNHG